MECDSIGKYLDQFVGTNGTRLGIPLNTHPGIYGLFDTVVDLVAQWEPRLSYLLPILIYLVHILL